MNQNVSEIEALMLSNSVLRVEKAKAVLLKANPSAWALLWILPCLIVWVANGETVARHFGISPQLLWPACLAGTFFFSLIAQVAMLQRRVAALSILLLQFTHEQTASVERISRPISHIA